MTVHTDKITFRSYRAEDRDWVTAAHVRHYTQVEGFSAAFADAVTSALTLLDCKIDDKRSHFRMMMDQDRPVGCCFLSAETQTIARLRLFYLERPYRGQGHGARLLSHMVNHARATGVVRLCVSTYDRHAAACGLYRKFGFQAQINAPKIAFGRSMRQTDFDLDLVAR